MIKLHYKDIEPTKIPLKSLRAHATTYKDKRDRLKIDLEVKNGRIELTLTDFLIR